MLKLFYILTLIFIIPLSSEGQDTIKKKEGRKYQIAFKTGGAYKFFVGKRYIDPEIHDPFNKYERFTKIPTYGFQIGFSFSRKISKKWGIASGLLYNRRQDIYKSNKDTIIKYNAVPTYWTHGYSYNDILNVIDYNYAYHNLELPFMINYAMKKFHFYGGVNLAIFSFYKSKYRYLTSSSILNPDDMYCDCGTEKTITRFAMPMRIYPTLQFSYDAKIKNLKLSPFLEMDFWKRKSLYLYGGIIIPIIY